MSILFLLLWIFANKLLNLNPSLEIEVLSLVLFLVFLSKDALKYINYLYWKIRVKGGKWY